MTPNPYRQLEVDLAAIWDTLHYEQQAEFARQLADTILRADANSRLERALSLLEKQERQRDHR